LPRSPTALLSPPSPPFFPLGPSPFFSILRDRKKEFQGCSALPSFHLQLFIRLFVRPFVVPSASMHSSPFALPFPSLFCFLGFLSFPIPPFNKNCPRHATRLPKPSLRPLLTTPPWIRPTSGFSHLAAPHSFVSFEHPEFPPNFLFWRFFKKPRSPPVMLLAFPLLLFF